MEITIYDCETGETITREMTEEESEELLARQKKSTEEYAKLDKARQALLQKLGLTENELRSLVG
jgi:predicted Zn-dependent peptidase